MKIKLYKGNLTPASISSPYTLYSEQIASFGEDDSYDQNDSAGFINLYGLPIKVKAIMDEKTEEINIDKKGSLLNAAAFRLHCLLAYKEKRG